MLVVLDFAAGPERPPKLLQPTPVMETSRPERPSLRIFMAIPHCVCSSIAPDARCCKIDGGLCAGAGAC